MISTELECGTSWTNFGPTLGTRSWTRISNKFQVVRGVLIQAHCPGYETRGSPVFGGRPIFCRARPYRNDPCCEKFLRAEPEKNLSFPPALNGFSHCGIHQDFDTLLCRLLPPWLCRTAAGLAAACTLLPRCTGRASAPILTSGLGLPGFKFRVKDASPRQ